MDRALYIAMNGGQQVMNGMAIHSNNLANANTHGFLSDFESARSMGVYYGDGFSSRAYVATENPGTDFSRGVMIETGRELDVAVEGDGWLAVQAPDGSEAYTRAGSLKITALGQLVTGNNLPVLGNGGPVALPPSTKIEIGSDGTITVQPQGQSPAVLAAVDRLKLVKPDVSMLEKGADGLMRHRDRLPLEPNANVTLQSGFLETSNVNPVDELTNIMSLSRQFEVNIKMMSAMEENSAAAARLLQLSA